MSAAGPWRCGRFEIALGRPVVMGIVNVTPDSFSDGGAHGDTGSALAWARQLIAEGADIVDVGGESTRPGAEPLTVAEELARVLPVVGSLSEEGAIVSIDTRHAEVATACIEAGASIVNDVSGFRDPAMAAAASASDAGVVVMHMLGEPRTMQVEPHYDDVVAEVTSYLMAQAAMLEQHGIDRRRIAIDPGIGFGKTLEHNLALLRGLPALASQGYPVLVGASRKRFIGEITGEQVPAERLGGSVAVALDAHRRGAAVLRVHDVAATVQAFAVERALGGE